jgi:regulatory protein
MQITAIKAQVKNPDRASIFVDGKYSFSLSLNELVAERLKSRQELSQPELDRLRKLSADGKLKGRALEWVLSRPHSTREFHDYMRRKKADPEQAEGWAQEFMERGYLSDESFAAWRIDVRRRGGKSERAIRSELMSKGVSREVIDEQLSGNDDDDGRNELQRLQDLINKKQRLSRYKTDPQKLIQYLASKGFGFDDIKRAMRGED